MTIEELKQYRAILKELEKLKIELKSQQLYDVVTGSDSDFPYTQHKMSVSGVDSSNCNMRLLKRINRLTHQKAKIEKFIYGIDDSLTRQIFELRYIRGRYRPGWTYVAMEVGGGNTPGNVRSIHSRYMRKHC